MLHPSDFHGGWRAALRALALSTRVDDPDLTPERDPIPDEGDDSDREPFHLDDPELASRLVRDRGLIHYSTPPHARLLFPDLGQS